MGLASSNSVVWHFQPLPPPDPLHPLLVHEPAGVPQQGGDAPVAVAAILSGQCDDVGGQRGFIFRLLGGLRWVERCWPKTRQASRSETPYLVIT